MLLKTDLGRGFKRPNQEPSQISELKAETRSNPVVDGGIINDITKHYKK